MKSKKTAAQERKQPAGGRTRRPVQDGKAVVVDFVLHRIELYNENRGGGVGVRKDSRGYTLYLEQGGDPIARLRPKEGDDGYQIFYWSPFRQRWQGVSMLGPLILPLDEALDFIADDPMNCFWY